MAVAKTKATPKKKAPAKAAAKAAPKKKTSKPKAPKKKDSKAPSKAKRRRKLRGSQSLRPSAAPARSFGKAPGGRPTIYYPGVTEDMLEYFFKDPVYREELTPDGFVRVASELPVMCGFASEIGVDEHTLLEWSKHEDKPLFASAYKKCKARQKAMIIQNGVQGRYNTAFTIFAAKNITDMTNDESLKVDANVDITVSIESMDEDD